MLYTICDKGRDGDPLAKFTTRDRDKTIDHLKAEADTRALIRDIARIHVEILDEFSRGERVDWFAERFENGSFPTADEYLEHLFDSEDCFELGGYTVCVDSDKDD